MSEHIDGCRNIIAHRGRSCYMRRQKPFGNGSHELRHHDMRLVTDTHNWIEACRWFWRLKTQVTEG